MQESSNSLLLNTISGNPGARPPFWYMRQAGRVLPSYRKLREKYSFWQLMKDPGLAAKVTLLPVDDLKTDAAILFSDILVIPYAMGMGLDFTDSGPVFENPLCQLDDPVGALHADRGRLDYIFRAIDQTVSSKPGQIPLIGFCGGPLTVLLYMLQGLSRKADFPDAIRYIYRNKATTRKLIDAVTELTVYYVKEQIRHGIEIFQLFETHAGILPWETYRELFLPAVRKIAKTIREEQTPFIFFPKGAGLGLKEIEPDLCDYLGIDWQTPLEMARKNVHPEIGLQGNIDPRLLYGTRVHIDTFLENLVSFGCKNLKWILNLGHGFLPDTPYENANYLSNRILEIDWKR